MKNMRLNGDLEAKERIEKDVIRSKTKFTLDHFHC